ncbi:MAG: oxidoreductase [Opitutaceae bacterium]
MRLEDKVIIVTGSTTGIGKAIARKCLEEGARVLIHGLEAELGAAVRTELDPGGEKTALRVADLTAPGSSAAVVDHAIQSFGQLDGLVNNAALVGNGTIQNTDEALFDRFISTNLRAPFFLIQAALPHLTRTRGSVVNIGSVNAHAGEGHMVPYSISKGGLMTLTRNLGDTLTRESGVRINQINPGWVLTEGEYQRYRDQGRPDNWPSHLSRFFTPSGRLFTPEEIAAAAIYFLSDESGPVSGSVLDIEQHTFLGRNLPKF